MERETPCVLLAWKDTLQSEEKLGAFRYVYSRLQVLDAPPDLPDGEYVAGFGEQTVSVMKRSGIWLPDWR
ncbi:MAG TPA: hypothetical protein VMD55_13080 [Terracidiphilus sp.]|nr:hypothetical protein [Terracidiphilus sp.]